MKKTFLRFFFTTSLLLSSEAFSKTDTTESLLPEMPKENLLTQKGKFLGNNAKKIQKGSIKTEGNYFGLDLVRTDSFYKSRTKYTEEFGGELLKFENSNNKKFYGASISYKYAFNFHNFFFAPGVFFDQNNFDGSVNEGPYGDFLKIKNRYGTKIDVGYDLNDIFAPYITAGYAVSRYNATSGGSDIDGNNVLKSRNESTGSGFFGAGLKINLNKKFALNFEYTRQKFDAKAGVPVEASDYIAKNYFTTKLHIIKLGLLYNF